MALGWMILDLLQDLLGPETDLDTMVSQLGASLRELTGARTVVLHLDTPPQTWVEPARRAKVADQTIAAITLAKTLPATTLWTGKTHAAFLPHQQTCVAVPLRPRGLTLGAILLLDLPDLHGIDQLLSTLDTVGRVVGLVLASSVRLHQREAEVAQRVAELHASEARFRSIAERSFDIIMLSDTTGRITYISPSATRITGLSVAELLGCSVSSLLEGESLEQALERWPRVLQGEVLRGSLALRTSSGTPVEVTYVSCPILEQGEVVGVQTIAHDLTAQLAERRKAEALKAQLHSAMRMDAVGRLAGGVAHDFNNLLTVIKTSTSLASEELDPADPVSADLREIDLATDRASALTRQLLAFSRKQVLAPKVLDLNMLIRDLERMLRRILGEDIRIDMSLSPSLATVRADPAQLEQVLMNLVVNARDAMPSGGVITIETANVSLDHAYASSHPSVVAGPYARLAVSDTGSGIDTDTLEHLFEPFYTTKSEGTGLGLSTVYGIVKQSRGNIWVYSEQGLGTTFKVYFPATSAPADHAPTRPPRSPRGGSETVLIVEDEPAVLRLARRILQREGYTVHCAADGPQAIALAASLGQIDLLLTDVVMPGMSGKTVADTLCADRPQLKVLFMSGYTDAAIVHHGVLSGDLVLLSKPFEVDALCRRVREVLCAPASGSGGHDH